MSKSNNIINLGNLSRPATVLTEKISNAIGTLYEPTHIKRVAEAEIQAEKIRAAGNLEITEIQQRGLSRLIQEEGKKQENIESITAQATNHLKEGAQPENIENDWISHFFEKCRNVSDSEMQSLWSGILAGESNKPGSYSKRTIGITSTLDKSDAHVFTSLCSFAITVGSGEVNPFILDEGARIYNTKGINFKSLSHLNSIGLIQFDTVGSFMLQNLRKFATFSYFDQHIILIFQNDSDNSLDFGRVMLTQAGSQLAPICGAQVNREFLDYMAQYYEKKGVEVKLIHKE